MPMTPEQSTRYDAIHLLAIAASGKGETLAEIAEQLGHERRTAPVVLARKAIVASIGAGNWREVRAEAEARLRTGWRPR